MPLKNRRSYDADFKRNAVNLSNTDGRTVPDVANSLGIDPQLLYRWRSQLKNQENLAFPGKGIEALTTEQKRIKELEQKLKDVEMERDILKKTIEVYYNR